MRRYGYQTIRRSYGSSKKSSMQHKKICYFTSNDISTEIPKGKAYAQWDTEWREKSAVRVRASLDLKYGLLIGFLKIINGLPADAFRFCESCKRWYFHLSKKNRKYCSEKCTKKMQARRRRSKEKKKRERKSPST